MNIWKTLRNVAYLILVLVIITIGFMVMLRTKINPQTVVSVESALPKIVVSLIYITFSFPIAGLLIDLTYVVIAIVISLLGSADPSINVAQMQQMYISAGPGRLMTGLFAAKTGGFNDNFFALGNIFWNLPRALLNLVPAIGNIVRILGSALGIYFIFPYLFRDVVDKLAGAVDLKPEATISAIIASVQLSVEGIFKILVKSGGFILAICVSMILGYSIVIPLLVGLLLFLTVLLLFFRLIMIVFGAYMKLILLILLSPLYLMLEAVPGQSTFIGWIRNLLNELIVFPVIIAIFILAILIIDGASSGNALQLPFLTSIDPKSYGLLIGMWFLFMIPDFIGIVQKMVNPKPLPLDAGLGTFFGGASTGISTGLGEMSKYALLAGQFKPLGKLFNLIPGFKKPGS